MGGENVRKMPQRPVLHVLVVGFHHKKGCQVEYSYPPLNSNGCVDSGECPSGWKYLPTLALPDGSHNYDQDTVFFHLPSLTSPDETVFGISCFRQIPVEKLKNKTADITRGTVQKSVCVLSSFPLYGHIQVKMELITHAYFDEGDFTKVSLLKDTYHHLNDCLEQIEDLKTAPQLFVGLSARDLVLRLRHKALLLYKLILLEKKVLFFHSPVQPLCSTILALLSLHPRMMEEGLYQSACIRTSRPLSPVPLYSDSNINNKSNPMFPSQKGVTALPPSHPRKTPDINGDGPPIDETGEPPPSPLSPPPFNLTSPLPALSSPQPSDKVIGIKGERTDNYEDDKGVNENARSESDPTGSSDDMTRFNGELPRDASMDLLHNTLASVAHIDPVKCSLPLQIFSNGNLCLPYLSLPYMDVLTDENVHGYVLGATNVLFKQKKNLSDVVVEVETGRIETGDVDLKRILHLTTEDLRFGEFLVRQVSEMRHDNYLDGVGWEGGDEWIRSQFHAYTLCLLRTSLLAEGSKEHDQFNRWFMSAWQETRSYKLWLASPGAQNILEVNPGHPFTGQLSVADMKLRLAHTMQTTEGGRKLNQAMASSGRVIATTGRAVGGALSQAKGALSNWWSNLTTPQSPVEGPMVSEMSSENENNTNKIDEAVEVVELQHPILQV